MNPYIHTKYVLLPQLSRILTSLYQNYEGLFFFLLETDLTIQQVLSNLFSGMCEFPFLHFPGFFFLNGRNEKLNYHMEWG